jgi:hypothetical protein
MRYHSSSSSSTSDARITVGERPDGAGTARLFALLGLVVFLMPQDTPIGGGVGRERSSLTAHDDVRLSREDGRGEIGGPVASGSRGADRLGSTVIYGLVLLAHSWLRWLVLALGIGLLTLALRGWRAATDGWSPASERLRRGFLGTLDTQMLLGLALYALLSPLPRAGLTDIGGALGSPVLRFYTIEHLVGMLVGIVVAHAGSDRAMRVEGVHRYRTLMVTQALWLLITLASIPWPGLPYGRPLLRGP